MNRAHGRMLDETQQAYWLSNLDAASRLRRILQVVCDLAKRPVEELSVLDLACGHSAFTIELALAGAQTHGMDARTERMERGIAAARDLKLPHMTFQQGDVRDLCRDTHGQYDVILFLGILYHLDVPDSFAVLEHLHDMAREFVVIDTHIALEGDRSVAYQGQIYHGLKWREHGPKANAQEKQQQLLSSIDNECSFWFTKESLVRLLNQVGFSSVYECYTPLMPSQYQDRVTWIAYKGQRAPLASYPPINTLTDERIYAELNVPFQGLSPNPPMQQLRADLVERAAPVSPESVSKPQSYRRLLGRLINAGLRPLGYALHRI